MMKIAAVLLLFAGVTAAKDAAVRVRGSNAYLVSDLVPQGEEETVVSGLHTPFYFSFTPK